MLRFLPCSKDRFFWFQCVIRGTTSSKCSKKIESAIKHKGVHLRMRSDRIKGQLIRISTINAEIFYSYPASGFFNNCQQMVSYSSLCILPWELSNYTENATALVTPKNKFRNILSYVSLKSTTIKMHRLCTLLSGWYVGVSTGSPTMQKFRFELPRMKVRRHCLYFLMITVPVSYTHLTLPTS